MVTSRGRRIPAERAALDAVAASEAGRWEIRGGRVHLIVAGRSTPVVIRAFRRPATVRDLPPPRLRFDRVALRVCEHLETWSAGLIPQGLVAFVAIRAPIRLASKTVVAIETSLLQLTLRPTDRERVATIHGNRVRLALLRATANVNTRLICVVHTHDADATRLLAMTRDLLHMARARRRSRAARLVIRTTEPAALLATYRHLFAKLSGAVPDDSSFMVFGDGTVFRLPD